MCDMRRNWKAILADPKHPIWKAITLLAVAAAVLVGASPVGVL